MNIFRKEQALSMYSKRRKSILRPVIEAQKKLNQHSSGAASSGKSRAKRTSAEPVTRLVQLNTKMFIVSSKSLNI